MISTSTSLMSDREAAFRSPDLQHDLPAGSLGLAPVMRCARLVKRVDAVDDRLQLTAANLPVHRVDTSRPHPDQHLLRPRAGLFQVNEGQLLAGTIFIDHNCSHGASRCSTRFLPLRAGGRSGKARTVNTDP